MSSPSSEFLKNAIYLVDSSSYIFRAYYAIRQPLTAPDGTPTHATYGFLNMILSLLDEERPDKVICVWDRKERGFRQDIYEEYKANRSAAPEDLGLQIQNTRIGLEKLGIPQIDCAGFEADDILATFVNRNKDHNFVLVTSDKDMLQLVNHNVWCLDTGKKKWSNREEAFEKFGVEPPKIPLVQALSGDSVDNIKGAPGIGPKTATELVQRYADLNELIEEAKKRFQAAQDKGVDKSDPLKGKRIEAIAANENEIRMSLKLVTLHQDAPIDTDLENYHRAQVDPDNLKEFSKKLGLTRLVERSEKVFAKLGSTPAAKIDPQENVQKLSVETAEPLTEKVKVPRDWQYKIVQSADELINIFKANASAPLMTLDTETFSLDSLKKSNLVSISLCFSEREGFYLPFRHFNSDQNLDATAVLPLLAKLIGEFCAGGKPLLFQNAKFDLHILLHESSVFSREFFKKIRIEDTMLASFVLDPAESHGMDKMAVKYLEGYETVHFDEVLGDRDNFSEVPLEEAAYYSVEDVVITQRLWRVLSEKLKSENLWKVYDEIDRPLVHVLVEMEEVGVSVDIAYLQRYSMELHKELKTIELEALESLKKSGVEVGEDFNLASTKQIAQVLFEKLQLPVLKKGKTGPSTDVTVLEELATMHPFPEKLLEIRELSKLISTYVDALPDLINMETGRLHTDFSQTIAATGRLSSSNPNLQNIPIRTERGRKIREAFRAGPGKVLVGIDYSQVELRILAHMTQDPELVKAFNERADIHKRTMALVLGKKESEITDHERRMAKAINFGIIYGQSAFGLSKALKISRAEAQKFIEDYFKTYPGIKSFMDGSIAQAKKMGYVETLTKRRRLLPEINSKNFMLRQFAERMAINSPIQGTAADVMKAAMIKTQSLMEQKFPGGDLVLQVHDELLFEVPADQAEAVKLEAQKIMEAPDLLKSFGINEFSPLIRSEANVGEHWGDL